MISPEVRQCRQQDSPMFGAVAVKAAEDRWGVMHPVNGGHWATDKDVTGWVVVNAHR